MDQAEFSKHALEKFQSIESALQCLQTQSACLQAFCLALGEQSGLDLPKLEEDYEVKILQVLEALPPQQQDPMTLARFSETLCRTLRQAG